MKAFFVFAFAAVVSAAVHSPLPPEEAQRAFQIDPGLRIELVAAEPLIQSPCAVAWDARGRMFVAENRGYPTGSPTSSPDGKPLGVISMLEDTNADGRMDKRTEFAADLTFPNGLLPWNDGLIVTCAPDILFLKDTNGDGRADLREVWLTGFDTTKTTQLRVSHPTLGPDGWIYLTSGWAGENRARSPKHPARPAVEFSTDSRFHPATLEIEPVDGRSQFGQSFDDFGNRFICFNRVHIQHVVLSSKLLQRNPDFAFSDTVQNVPETMLSDLISGANQNPAARIYPISENITTADSHAGQFSAACAITIYRGNGLPTNYYGDAFACDPTGNLVHRDKLTPAGPTFSSRMANEGREFLASPDNWFRPVNLAVGPDGALYICDLYRKTIEHPEYLPAEVRKRTDFESGRDKGRIWRITSRAATNQNPGFESQSASELVKLLAHPNIWHRDTARRLLLERYESGTFSLLLEQLPDLGPEPEILELPRSAADPAGPGPHLARINALDMLFALGGGRSLTTQDKSEIDRYSKQIFAAWGADRTRDAGRFFTRLIRATLDESPGVRRAAFRWLTAMPGQGPDVGGDLLRHWGDDPNPQARFQIALFFGKTEWSETFPPLARIARRDGADRWMRAAILSALRGRAQYFFDTLMRQTNSAPAPELMRALCRLELHPHTALLALTDPNAAEDLYGARQIKGESDAAWQIAGLAGLAEGFRSRAGTAPSPKLAEFVDKEFGDPRTWRTDGRHLRELLSLAEKWALDSSKAPAVRDAALVLIAHEKSAEAAPILLPLLKTGELPELQQAAARALASLPGDTAARELLAPARWREFSPAVRAAVLSSLLAQPRHTATLLESLEAGVLPPREISRAQRDRLLKHKDPVLRARAEKLFTTNGGGRMKVYEDHKSLLELTANSRRGREIFKTHCASCHRLDREGFSVGPDLFGMRNQPKEAILLHLLVPNHEINPGFNAYEIETRDGRALTGLIASETAASLTLRQPLGIEETLRRTEIVSLKSTSLSLMPDELEKTMSRQDLADLLAFLKGE